MHHAAVGERRAKRQDEFRAAAPGHGRMPRHVADPGRLHVGGGEHCQHAFRLARRGCVDLGKARERVRGAHEIRKSARLSDVVVDEAALAAQQAVVLDADGGVMRFVRAHAEFRMEGRYLFSPLPCRSRIYPTSATFKWPNSGKPEFGGERVTREARRVRAARRFN